MHFYGVFNLIKKNYCKFAGFSTLVVMLIY